MATLEGLVGGQCCDLALQAHDAMTVGFSGTRGRDDAVHVAGIRNSPLKRLLRAHGEADDRLQMAHPKLLRQQLMHRLHVVADGGDGKARTVEWLWRVAGRRG